MDSLLDAYQTIWEELPLLGAFQKLFSDQPYMKTILSCIYQDILNFHREAMGYFRHKGKSQAMPLVRKGLVTRGSALFTSR